MDKYLEVRDISKAFPGVQALQDIELYAEGGKVTALLGENGAGKSTLLKILSGALKPDTGTVSISGKPIEFNSTHAALDAGISIIYQERQLMPMMSVAENIFLDDAPAKKLGFVDGKKLRAETQVLLDKFGLKFSPDELVGRLPVAYQQMIEIIKAYRRDADIIAFDEPTAPLTETEIKTLFNIIEELKSQGKVVLYVSHRMNEIFQITDSIVILKDGKLVKQVNTAETNEQELIRAMVGRDIGDTYSNLSRNDKFGDVILEAKGLTTDVIKDVSFTLRRGEVLGFAGLVGAGRSEIMRALTAVEKRLEGDVYLKGEKADIKNPSDALHKGIGFLTEDRRADGCALKLDIKTNINMSSYDSISKYGFINLKKESKRAEEYSKNVNVKTPSISQLVGNLSGGNQQKVVIAKLLCCNPEILIFDEPTVGIDVGAKQEIFKLIEGLTAQGKGIILISSYLPEVMGLSDRLIVMAQGKITAEYNKEELKTLREADVLRMASIED